MANRTITDTAGRTWTCSAVSSDAEGTASHQQGRDVVLSCATPSISEPVRITVGWQWESMSQNGLGRLLTDAAPAPRR